MESPEWRLKRESILKRDGYKCTKCKLERPKFLGINRKVGVLDYKEFSSHGRLYLDLDNNKAHLMFYPGLTIFSKTETYIYGNITNSKAEDLKFAEQSIDGKSRLICFIDEFSNDDIKPDLNVHHKYYVQGKKAWEYNDVALVTLCADCHMQEHLQNEIFIYTVNGNKFSKVEICYKCSGSGHLREYNYYYDVYVSHVMEKEFCCNNLH